MTPLVLDDDAIGTVKRKASRQAIVKLAYAVAAD